MALRISRQDYGDITVLELAGSMSMGNLCDRPSFREAVDDLIRSHRSKIVLLYSGVPYQDSMGNGEIVSAFTRVRNAGGTLVFVGLTQKISDLFQITKLITVFPVFNTLDEALSHLGYSQDSV
jgi:anti-sigma B factor antagonist